MIHQDNKQYGIIFLSILIFYSTQCQQYDGTSQFQDEQAASELISDSSNASPQARNNVPDLTIPRTISAIYIRGNKFISTDAIMRYIPYMVSEVFNPQKTRNLIKNIYTGLKWFRNITVKAQNKGSDYIDLIIEVEEKTPLKEIVFTGNNQLTEKEIRKKINLDMPAIDAEELKPIAQKIKRLYLDKGYFSTTIKTHLELDEQGRGTAHFLIDEGKKSLVKRILFSGNDHISSKELRQHILTREDWLLSFFDKSGLYHPDRLDADKHMIEQLYQNRGYLHAKVTNIIKDIDPDTQEVILTFEIEEGELYTIGTVEVLGYDKLSPEYLQKRIPIAPGDIYSYDAIHAAIKTLEHIWGDQGYIFAHIIPTTDIDPATKTVNLTFGTELGNQVLLNQITIRGNLKTRDKIIRRKLLLNEGSLLTTSAMELSKHNVETLGYFEARDGVNWKINRTDNDLVDLDLIVKETRTGHFNFQLGFGGAGVDLKSPSSGFNAKLIVSDTNLFGSGIHLNTETSWSKKEQTIVMHIAEPWLFDKPISGAFDFYHKRPTYDELRNIDIAAIASKVTGSALTAGFITHAQSQFLSDTLFLTTLGIDSIRYTRNPKANFFRQDQSITDQYQRVLDKEFTPGTFVWLAHNLEQDHRNHPIHTSRGHKWKITSKIAFPSFGDSIGFYKLTADACWYTPLINEFDLIFRLRGFAGIITQFKNRIVPFGELFHIGGPASVRGFNFGQIGPKFLGDTIGATKALFWSAELIFPINHDMTMKAHFFYDGGAGFNNPNLEGVSRSVITGNSFDYRHSVGFGIRLLQPMPIRIDWGFKIDPRINKQDPTKSESSHEIHFGMSYDW